MVDGILDTVKLDLGIAPGYDHFDQALVSDINTAFSVLLQLGYGPENGFRITGFEETWDQYIDPEDESLEMIKSYISKSVRLMFDAPLNSAVLTSVKEKAAELEWRINVATDHYVTDAERAALSEAGDG